MAIVIGPYSWEDNDTPTAPTGIVGTPHTSTTAPYRGTKHCEITAADSSSTRHSSEWTPGGVNNRDYFVEYVFAKLANPSSPVRLVDFGSLADGFWGSLILNTDGTLQAQRNGSLSVGSPSPALASSPYNLLGLRVRLGTSNSNGQIEARLNGVQFALATSVNLGTASRPESFRLGVENSSGGTGGTTLRFDCVQVNDDQGTANNTWPSLCARSALPLLGVG